MAIITEEPEYPHAPILPKKPTKKPTKNPSKPSQNQSNTSKPTNSNPNPFIFWFYFTLTVSVLTLVVSLVLPFFYPQDPKSWFLSLPTSLRTHYSSGRSVKVQLGPSLPSIEVFVAQNGAKGEENVLIVHGLGFNSYGFRKVLSFLGERGVNAVALDLPGHGFSDKSMVVLEERERLGLLGVWDEIREKGLFWGFDQLVEKGYVNMEEIPAKKTREVVKGVEIGAEEMGRVLGQVIDSLGLAPVDLVLHDSAFVLGANWVLENIGIVRSVTILDGSERESALPLWALEVPVVREVVLGFRYVFGKVVGRFCLKSSGDEVEAHRVLLKGRDGRRAVVGMGKRLNHSFDISEWGGLDSVKGLRMQVIWSNSWSEEWSEEGRQVANALPQANFVTHSGGRWPQEDKADELAETIYGFTSSLPKTTREANEEPIPEHIQKLLDEAKAKGSDYQHQHQHGHGDDDHHHHDHEPGFMDAYGLGHAYG